jgi:predicted TIM-barrel fold metal-dependent hydrolase
MVPGAYDVKARIEAMDEDGVWAQLMFPTFPRFAGTLFIKHEDSELTSAVIQAYNDWMIDEWCAYAPERFIPMILLQLWDPELAAKEIHRSAAKGARAITFPEGVSQFGLPSVWTDFWDPVFSAAEDTGLVLCTHVGTSGSLMNPSPESAKSSDAVPISLAACNTMAATADLIFSGILHRHPKVKISLAEGGSGWVPYLLERMDYTWARTRTGVDRSLSPSELFERHFWTCFISDRFAVENRDEIGVHKLMWESDYPHNDSQWPDSRKLLAEYMADVPDEDVHKIVELNARALFNFPA